MRKRHVASLAFAIAVGELAVHAQDDEILGVRALARFGLGASDVADSIANSSDLACSFAPNCSGLTNPVGHWQSFKDGLGELYDKLNAGNLQTGYLGGDFSSLSGASDADTVGLSPNLFTDPPGPEPPVDDEEVAILLWHESQHSNKSPNGNGLLLACDHAELYSATLSISAMLGFCGVYTLNKETANRLERQRDKLQEECNHG